jgi:hypothetical protein
MYRYLTLDEIVVELSQTLKLETRRELVALAEHELVLLLPSLGDFIKQRYRLFDEKNPLTASWHAGTRYVVGGIDMSDDHPDEVALTIMLRLRRRLVQLGVK